MGVCYIGAFIMHRLRLSPLHLAYLRKGYTPINPALRMKIIKDNNLGHDLAFIPVNPKDIKERYIRIDLEEVQPKQIKISLEELSPSVNEEISEKL